MKHIAEYVEPPWFSEVSESLEKPLTKKQWDERMHKHHEFDFELEQSKESRMTRDCNSVVDPDSV